MLMLTAATAELYIYIDMHIYYYLYKSFPGLCGDFNDAEVDDFKGRNGLMEGTAVAFAKSWRTDSKCPQPSNRDDEQHPCLVNTKKGQ